MRGDDAVGDVQPQAQPGRNPLAPSGAIEALEEMLLLLRRNADALILDPHNCVSLILRQSDGDCTAAGAVFGSVAEQVVQHLLDQSLVADYQHQFVGGVQFDRQRLHQPRLLHAAGDSAGQVNCPPQHLEPASGDARDIEQVVDHHDHPLGAFEDGIEWLL